MEEEEEALEAERALTGVDDTEEWELEEEEQEVRGGGRGNQKLNSCFENSVSRPVFHR